MRSTPVISFSPCGPYFRNSRSVLVAGVVLVAASSRTLKPEMEPSSCRRRAISALSRDAGMSTRVCLAVTALRIRVSISAIGSVIAFSQQSTVNSRQFTGVNGPSTLDCELWTSPATFCYPSDIAFERQLAEAQAAQPELAHEAARPPAQLAAVPQPNPVLRRFFLFGYLRGRRHIYWLLNGIPMNCSSLRASSSVLAVVTTDTFMPRALSTFMESISGHSKL